MGEAMSTFTNHYQCGCRAEWHEERRAIIDAECERCGKVVRPHRYIEHKPPHNTVADVRAALADPRRIGLGTTPFAHLPLFARVAIEWIDRDNSLRNAAALDRLLQHFADSHGQRVDLESCAAAHGIAARRFYDFQNDCQAGGAA